MALLSLVVIGKMTAAQRLDEPHYVVFISAVTPKQFESGSVLSVSYIEFYYNMRWYS